MYPKIRPTAVLGAHHLMKRRLQGHYLKVATAGEALKVFVPAPLPPRPAINWSPALRGRFDAALLAIGRLDAVTDVLPNAGPLLNSFVRKEAVLSSMIEGTHSSLADLMLYELHEQPGVPVEDAREVSRYVAALEHGLNRLRGGFPLSLRLLREVHKVLLSDGRGSRLTPGEFRHSQVWIGGPRPAPPRPHWRSTAYCNPDLLVPLRLSRPHRSHASHGEQVSGPHGTHRGGDRTHEQVAPTSVQLRALRRNSQRRNELAA